MNRKWIFMKISTIEKNLLFLSPAGKSMIDTSALSELWCKSAIFFEPRLAASRLFYFGLIDPGFQIFIGLLWRSNTSTIRHRQLTNATWLTQGKAHVSSVNFKALLIRLSMSREVKLIKPAIHLWKLKQGHAPDLASQQFVILSDSKSDRQDWRQPADSQASWWSSMALIISFSCWSH